MLTALRLRDFVIVDQAHLEFSPGFTVLTGETGAGKSILIDALGLALGLRADAGVVREGASRADITAEFTTDAALDAWLAGRDLAGDAGQVLLRRIVEADGRSRALVNGHPATVAQLREVAESLVEIHGQHASQALLRAEGQRALLDRFAGAQAELAAVGQAFARWRSLERDLEQAQRNSRELALERERLQWQLDELAPLKPEPGDWDALNAEQKRLANAAALIDGTRSAADALAEADESVASRIHQLLQRLRPLAQLDASLAPTLELLEGAAIQASEAASALAAYADRVDLDPQRLERTEQRIGALFASARKLKIAPAQLASEFDALQARMRQLELAHDLGALQQHVAQARAEYDRCAHALSRLRAGAAKRLSSGVSERIARLGMKGGSLQIALDAAEPGAAGSDRVEFRVAGHTGATPRPLGKVASGGELSRISLAVSELAAEANPVATLIFDEADAGVGGAVAEVVGDLMRRLGETRQVLCVTHLPQVAARANQHLRVSKASREGSTVSTIDPLERAARIEEIARMLGGVQITATTRKHAREMLAQC